MIPPRDGVREDIGARDRALDVELSLPCAFYVAGAKNVLAALRPIGDFAVKTFMAHFFKIWLAQPISDPALACAGPSCTSRPAPTPQRSTQPPGSTSSFSKGRHAIDFATIKGANPRMDQAPATKILRVIKRLNAALR